MTVHLMDERFDTGPILAQGTRPMPTGSSIEAFGPVLQSLGAELIPGALRRVVAGDRGDAQTEVGASYAPHSKRTTPSSTLAAPRAELERQVRAWSLMFDRSVTGPIAAVGDERVRVLDATLEDPGDPATLRLETDDGPLWLTSVERL